MPQPADTAEARDDRNSELLRDATGQLVLIDASGVRHASVIAQRTFPLTCPESWISLGTGRRELVMVEDLASLPASIQQLLREDLAQREFAPRITRLLDVIPIGE